MGDSGRRRIDVWLGIMACLIAILGLIASLASSNENAHFFGRVTSENQKALVAIASVFLLLCLAKAVIHLRNRAKASGRRI